jgi:long-chain acyl-CoA synthetase
MEIVRNFDLLVQLKEKFNREDSFASKVNGSWVKISTNDFIDQVNNLSYGLLSLGLNKGDRLAIISGNRPEWNIIDFAASQLGIVTVPMYPTLSVNDYNFIMNDAEVKAVFVENKDMHAKVVDAAKSVPSIQHIFSINELPGVKNWKEVLNDGKGNPNPSQVKTLADSVNGKDLLTLIYTSGTTGTPKGVMLSHENIISNLKAASHDVFTGDLDGGKALSFLPLCHIFERTVSYCYMYIGVSIYYAESMETIGDNLKEVQPDVFSTVPRLLEKVFDKIMAKGHEQTGIKKKLFFWAVDLGLRYELRRKNGFWYHLQLSIANKLIFSKWREALGGNLKFIFSGAAALQPRLARIFSAGNIIVIEGYGLTETSPVISANRIEEENREFGTVGPVISGVEVKIDAGDGGYKEGEGEICCKGPNVMMGYYKRPDLTAEVIKDGWFHTGDVGKLVDGKFLKITDRKKEVFKTSGGKYVAPQPMENKFKESLYVEQIMVIGENRKHPAALVVPAWDQLKKWASENGVSAPDNAALVKDPKVKELYQKEIARYNADFGSWEQVKKFELIPNDWTVDGGEMTPTLKLKRKPIMEKYSALVDRIYGE